MTLPVLILENEPQVRSLITKVLSNQGFPILEAEEGSTAFASVKGLHGDMTVIVSSFSLPELNGDAFARLLKAEFPNTPTLLMFSGASDRDVPPGDAFLPKPFRPSELVDTVRRLQEKQQRGTSFGTGKGRDQ